MAVEARHLGGAMIHSKHSIHYIVYIVYIYAYINDS
jgi:hypothetical protein